MRVLAEQTGDEVRAALQRLNLLWDSDDDHAGKVGVHVLMGGSAPGPWHQYPEQCAVIIGTQDMFTTVEGRVRTDIAHIKTDLLKWPLPTMLAQVAAIAALVKLT